jgi:hypothetical protein
VATPYANLRPTQRRFLLCFEACASVTVAARWAKLARQNHYDWLEQDPAYAECFARAEPRANRTLEDEAVRRAHQGLRRDVRYKGKVVGHEMEYSDTLMNTLLKATPKFRDKLDLGGSVTVVKRVIGVPDDAV